MVLLLVFLCLASLVVFLALQRVVFPSVSLVVLLLSMLVLSHFFVVSSLLGTTCILMLGVSSSIFVLLSFPKDPSTLISSIPSSIQVPLLISGGELICPQITTILARVPHVWFLSVVTNSPFTRNSFFRVVSLSCWILIQASSLIYWVVLYTGAHPLNWNRPHCSVPLSRWFHSFLML